MTTATLATPTPPNTYDQVPYLNRAHTRTHPDRLAALATLLGLDPPCLDRCRVLELGCANGRNLLPIASLLPGAEFVGVDLSARQIADGQAAVAELGLKNLTLRHADLAAVDASYGAFDYIICHGVYSWVDAPTQDRILAICRANLAPGGVAYVSYNTLPGWHDKLRVREMLLQRVDHIVDPQVRIRKAREFLNLITDLVAPKDQPVSTAYGSRLRDEAELVNGQDDDYIFHEYLEQYNTPIYFYEFAQRAAQHDLQYLADADLGLRSLDRLPAEVLDAMRQHADGIVAQEQLLDYYTNRTFHASLLVPAGQRVDRSVTTARLRRLLLRSPLQAVAALPDIAGSTYETFAAADLDSTYATAHPATKAAVLVLRDAYPRAVPFDDLIAAACARVYPAGELASNKVILTREAETVGLNLLQGHMHDNQLIDVHAFAPALAAHPGQRATALPSARFEALHGRSVTNAYHRPVGLGTLAWYLLPFLDGTRDVDALVELVMANQTLAVEKAGEELNDPAVKRPLLRAQVASSLDSLARAALLLT